jgi:hypothetical protein
MGAFLRVSGVPSAVLAPAASRAPALLPCALATISHAVEEKPSATNAAAPAISAKKDRKE